MVTLHRSSLCGRAGKLFAGPPAPTSERLGSANDSQTYCENFRRVCSFCFVCVWSSTASTSHPGRVISLSRKTGKMFGSGSRSNQSEHFEIFDDRKASVSLGTAGAVVRS